MRKSLYRQIIFGLSVVNFILLIVVATELGVFKRLGECKVLPAVKQIFANSYVSSVLCSIIAVVIIYFVQVTYSKRMLKKDFRCNEIIEDIYNCIKRYAEIVNEIPEIAKRLPDEDFDEKRHKDSLIYYEFYKRNLVDMEIIAQGFTYPNNDILIQSVESCFFLILNY